MRQVVTPALMTGAAVLALHRLLLELQQQILQGPSDGAPSIISITLGEIHVPAHRSLCRN